MFSHVKIEVMHLGQKYHARDIVFFSAHVAKFHSDLLCEHS